MAEAKIMGGEDRDHGSLPSVLAVTSELPWPLDSGGHLRTYHLLKALAQRFRVRLVTAAGSEAGIEALRTAGITLCPARVNPRSRWREVLRAATAAATGQPYVLYRRHDRRAVRAALRYQLAVAPPDVLYFDHLDSFVFQGLRPQTPFVIDFHNVYSTLARRSAREQGSFWLRLYLQRESRLLEQIERRAVLLASRLLAVSEDDGRFFEGLGGLSPSIVPNGVDCDAYRELPTGRRRGRPIILYVGTMSWAPNVSAAEYLAKNTLPRVRNRYPEAILRIVGRDPSPSVVALGRISGVEVTGSVPDMIPHETQDS
jgi:glycosyltransferase involved in cell wall biosynthesis